MRIAIDGRTLTKLKTGVGIYTERTIRSLLHIDQNIHYTLFINEDDLTLTAPNLTNVVIGNFEMMDKKRYWENFLLPKYLKRNDIKLYFSPAYALPFTSNFPLLFPHTQDIKLVVTIHDLIAYLHPETFTAKMRLWQKLFVWNATKVSNLIIAVSESTKRDILHYFSYPAARITVVHNSVDEHFHPIKNVTGLNSIRDKYKLPQHFILYVGTIEPRKNVTSLARAYSILPEAIRSKYHLVLCGGLGWCSEAILSEIDALRLGNRLIRVGYVEQQDLPAIYNLAELFVYPPLYEGFGYPPLEAMACGIPTISSNTSSLPEVIGDAGILVNPTNYHEIAESMASILTNSDLHQRLAKLGRERAALFNWKKNALETLEVLERAVRE
ncbi:MAG: glycosyltransferase family 1 protein [bacterium]